jgi:hypothetical protein
MLAVERLDRPRVGSRTANGEERGGTARQGRGGGARPSGTSPTSGRLVRLSVARRITSERTPAAPPERVAPAGRLTTSDMYRQRLTIMRADLCRRGLPGERKRPGGEHLGAAPFVIAIWGAQSSDHVRIVAIIFVPRGALGPISSISTPPSPNFEPLWSPVPTNSHGAASVWTTTHGFWPPPSLFARYGRPSTRPRGRRANGTSPSGAGDHRAEPCASRSCSPRDTRDCGEIPIPANEVDTRAAVTYSW